jgi:hypothetical protein
MDQHEMLRYAAMILDRLGVPYYVTGSFAGVLYGEYRMTNDIDVVVELRERDVEGLLEAFPQDVFYVDRDAVLDAIKSRFQFNVIHREALTKIDIIVSPGSAHDREAMRRVRRLRSVIEYDVAYCSPEDLLLKKLTFHKESGSEKHLRDCVGIVKKSGTTLDWEYLEKWSDWLDVRAEWKKVQKLAVGGSA